MTKRVNRRSVKRSVSHNSILESILSFLLSERVDKGEQTFSLENATLKVNQCSSEVQRPAGFLLPCSALTEVDIAVFLIQNDPLG